MADASAMRQKLFENQRASANQGIKAQQQEAEGALNRRMAAMGQQGGAAIGAQMKLGEQVAQQRAGVERDINNQELQANIASQEQGENRQFQSREAQLGREFAGSESRLGREFAGGESRLGREFAASQAEKDMGFKRQLFDIENANKQKEIDLAYKQFELDKDSTAFNRRIAEVESGKKATGLFGGTGPLGIGGGCFLTTATVDVMGLADDCWVLESARHFRDTYMAQDPERAGQVLRYYESAPQIVEKINARSDAGRVWKSFFWRDVIPFVDAINSKEMGRAHALYLGLLDKAAGIAGGE